MRITVFLAFVVALLHALPAQAASTRHKHEKDHSLDQLLKKLLKDGEAGAISPGRAKLVGLEPGTTSQALSVGHDEATDEIDHTAELVLDPAAPVPAPYRFLFRGGREEPEKKENWAQYFRADLKGHLEFSVRSHGRLDEQGKPIRGSGVAEPVDIASPEVRKAFQHELDFWLKGKFRKKKEAK